MHIRRQVRDIPDGDPVPGATMQVFRATDGVSVGSAVTDADGFAELFVNGSPGPVKTRFLKGSTIWSDDSRSLMGVGSHSLAELRDLIASLHTDGYLPWGNQFAYSSGIGSFTVSTGAVVLDGVVAVYYTPTTVSTSDGDIAIVIRQANADGRTELAAIDYSTIGSVTCVPLWRCTVTSGSASSIVWIGVRTLRGINTYHKCEFGNVLLASGSTTNASGEASSLTTTLTLETGVHYQVTAKGSFIARARDGAIAISINGNLSAYRTNSGDVQVRLGNSHVRDVTGAGACVVTVYHRSDTALTQWALQATYGSFGAGTSPIQFNSPQQVAVTSAGKVYVADTGNNRLVRLNSDGTYDTSITGLTTITGVAVDPSDNVYVCFAGATGTVRKYNASLVQQWSADLGTTLRHIAVDATWGWVVEGTANLVVRFSSATGPAGTAFGGTGSANGQFNAPTGICVFGGETYVVDDGNNRIQVFNASKVYQRQWSIPAGCRGIAPDASGDVLVASYSGNAVYHYTNTGTLIDSFAQATPDGIGVASGDVLWVSNGGLHTIAKWDETAAAFNWDAGLLSAIAVPRT